MENHTTQKRYYTPSEVAELLMVSPITVRLWSQKGDLQSITTPGGHRRYLQEHIQAFAKLRNIPLLFNNRLGTRVLIVDDDEILANYLHDLLEQDPRMEDVRIAADGFKAGTLVYTFDPDIILLDLKMPHIDGFEVCSDLKKGQMTKNIRVIAMSGYYDQENVNRITQAGAEAFLKKPFTPEELYEAIGLELAEVTK